MDTGTQIPGTIVRVIISGRSRMAICSNSTSPTSARSPPTW
jgi:hypothetical protein